MRLSRWFSRSAAAGLVIGSVLLLAACPPRERIADIDRDPGRFQRREITVAGRVVNSFAVMGEGAFQVDDGTGRIWVYGGKYGVPGRNTGVAVTGRIQQGFTLGGRTFAMVLLETHQRHYEDRYNRY